MPAIKFLLVYEHVAFRAAGLDPVALLQDHNGISYMAVRKFNLDVGLYGCPPTGIPPLGTGGA